MDKKYSISLLFNANKTYDRQILKGIGEYIQASQCNWNIYLEDDFTTHLDSFATWDGDGVIADLDDPDIEQLLSKTSMSVVGIGGSYENKKDYPPFPYIATDNQALIELAFQHLREKGLEDFAFYGINADSSLRWAKERENAFQKIIDREGYSSSVYCSNETNPQTWQQDMDNLSSWLQSLTRPVGIVAVTDARARHLLQACEQLNILVPDEISIIGIDNEELAHCLTRTSLSSVGQGCKQMGYQAAKMLHKLMSNEKEDKPIEPSQLLVRPTQIFERQSTDYRALKDPYVIQSMHYIRHNACRGIKVEQVLDFVGISRSNMEARFRSERGHSLHQEIHNAKFQRACTLLKSTDLPLTEISELCGYPSLQYMYNVFKKNIDETPKSYRSSE